MSKRDSNNIIETQYAEYYENKKIFISKGVTKFTSSENYIILSEDLFFDNASKIIKSKKPTEIIDQDNNKIFLENFEYSINDSIFKSVGLVKIEDKLNNSYEFSQIYIDTKKEILGTDIKAFINQDDFKVNENNKPRIFQIR